MDYTGLKLGKMDYTLIWARIIKTSIEKKIVDKFSREHGHSLNNWSH